MGSQAGALSVLLAGMLWGTLFPLPGQRSLRRGHLEPSTTLAKFLSSYSTQVMDWVSLQPRVSPSLREQSRTKSYVH